MDYTGLTGPDQYGHPEKGMRPTQLGLLDTQLDPCSYLALSQGIPVQTDQGLIHVPVDDGMLESLSASFSSASPVAPYQQPFSAPQIGYYLGQALALGEVCTGQPGGAFDHYDETLSPTSSMGATYIQVSDHCSQATPSWDYQLPEAGVPATGSDEWAPEFAYTPYSCSAPLSSSAMSMISDSQNTSNTVPSIYNSSSRRSSVTTALSSSKPSKRNNPKATLKARPKTNTKASPKPAKHTSKPPRHPSPPSAAPTMVSQHTAARSPNDGSLPVAPSDTTGDTDGDEQYSTEAQRARNRLATTKCRAKAKAVRSRLEADSRAATEHRDSLVASVARLRDQVLVLKSELLRHAHCGCPLIHEYMQNAARKLGEGLPGPVEMPEGMPKIEPCGLVGSGDDGDDDDYDTFG